MLRSRWRRTLYKFEVGFQVIFFVLFLIVCSKFISMPGENCAVFGCGTCRRHKGASLWKLPALKDEEHKKWRSEWLALITRTRTVDEDFRRQIENDKIFTCEKHFRPEDLETCKYNLKMPRLMVIRVSNLLQSETVLRLQSWSPLSWSTIIQSNVQSALHISPAYLQFFVSNMFGGNLFF